MFLNQGRPSGWIEVVCGPMFSGKTETLLKRVYQTERFYCQKAAVFKPITDTRHEVAAVISHNGTSHAAQWIARDASELPHDVALIALDEVQFFSLDAVPRILDALQFVEQHGEVCPANWHPGDKTMKADPKGSLKYFESVNK